MGLSNNSEWLLNTVSELLKVCSLDGIALGDKKGKDRAIVWVERSSTGTLDFDNFVGGAKAVVDCVRNSKLVSADTTSEIIWSGRQIKIAHRKDKKTVIKIRYPR